MPVLDQEPGGPNPPAKQQEGPSHEGAEVQGVASGRMFSVLHHDPQDLQVRRAVPPDARRTHAGRAQAPGSRRCRLTAASPQPLTAVGAKGSSN